MLHLLHHHDRAGRPAVAPVDHVSTTRRSIAFFVLLLCCFAAIVDLTVTNLALPAIATDLHVGVGALQWVVDAYNIAIAGLLLLGGGLADRFGRKRIFLLGFAIFGVGCLVASFAPTVGVLVAARAVMGTGAALVLTPSLAIIAVLFPPEERARAISIWAIVGGIGIAVGPVIGGLLLDHFWWGSVFLINVPLVVVAVIVGIVALPESRKPDAGRLDPVGAVLSVIGLGVFLFGIIEGPERGWGSPLIIGSIVVGALTVVAFFVWELRHDAPMFDVRILGIVEVSMGSFVLLLDYIVMTGMLFLVPSYLQSIEGISVVDTGFLLMPFALSFVAMSQFMPRLVARVRVSLLSTVGLAFGLAAMLTFVAAPHGGGTFTIVIGLLLAGVGIALMLTPSSTLIINGLPESKTGEGSSTSMLSRFLGACLGVAIAGTVFSMAFASRMESAAKSAGVDVPSDAVHSFHSAVADAGQMDGDAGRMLVRVAHGAFDDAFIWAFGSIAAVVAVGLVVMLVVDRRLKVGPTDEIAVDDIDGELIETD